MLVEAEVADWERFDFRAFVRRFAQTDAEYRARKESISLYREFLDCQLQLAAENVRQLGALAREIVNRPITLSANTCLPELPHLVVTEHLTHLVGEVDHRAVHGTSELLHALLAYRMAEALGKPLAATAKGQDWAYVKEFGATHLVKIWIALGFCMGQRLMAPHRQWCYTNEKGSHWYDGPTDAFAPLYLFVRTHPELFRDTRTIGPLAVPANIDPQLDTNSGRVAFAQMLAAGDPQPLRCGNAWLFPRRSASGALIVHVLNLAYSSGGDTIEMQKVNVVVPIDFEMNTADKATVYAFDAPVSIVEMRRIEDEILFTLSELRVWSVVKFGE